MFGFNELNIVEKKTPKQRIIEEKKICLIQLFESTIAKRENEKVKIKSEKVIKGTQNHKQSEEEEETIQFLFILFSCTLRFARK